MMTVADNQIDLTLESSPVYYDLRLTYLIPQPFLTLHRQIIAINIASGIRNPLEA